jgi:hypothetical protein
MITHIKVEGRERRRLVKILNCAKEYLFWEMQNELNELSEALNKPQPDLPEVNDIHEKLEFVFSKYIIIRNFTGPDSDEPIPVQWIEVALEIYKDHVGSLEDAMSQFQYQSN